MSLPSLDDVVVDDLHHWLDGIPFSRVRKSISRDFSDGVLVAEIVAHYMPRYVDLRAFLPASAAALKKYNWETLNRKVFPRLNFHVPPNVVDAVVAHKPGSVEYVLANLRLKIDLALKNYGMNGKRQAGKRTSIKAGSATNLTYDLGGSNLSICSGSSLAEPRNSQSIEHSAIATSYAKLQLDDLVPSELLYLAQQRQLEKEERIQAAEARIRHLEQLVAVKDRRIQYLTERLNTVLQFASSVAPQACGVPSLITPVSLDPVDYQSLPHTPVNGEGQQRAETPDI